MDWDNDGVNGQKIFSFSLYMCPDEHISARSTRPEKI